MHTPIMVAEFPLGALERILARQRFHRSLLDVDEQRLFRDGQQRRVISRCRLHFTFPRRFVGELRSDLRRRWLGRLLGRRCDGGGRIVFLENLTEHDGGRRERA